MMMSDYHVEDPVLDKMLSMEQNLLSLEEQNKLLLAKLDQLSAMLLQTPLFTSPAQSQSHSHSHSHGLISAGSPHAGPTSPPFS
jgi:hypothetical protein